MGLRVHPLLGAAAVSICLGSALGARLASSSDYRVDRMIMTTACAGAEPIYRAPDGGYWVWRAGWRKVSFSTGDTCRWDTYPAPEPS